MPLPACQGTSPGIARTPYARLAFGPPTTTRPYPLAHHPGNLPLPEPAEPTPPPKPLSRDIRTGFANSAFRCVAQRSPSRRVSDACEAVCIPTGTLRLCHKTNHYVKWSRGPSDSSALPYAPKVARARRRL